MIDCDFWRREKSAQIVSKWHLTLKFAGWHSTEERRKVGKVSLHFAHYAFCRDDQANPLKALWFRMELLMEFKQSKTIEFEHLFRIPSAWKHKHRQLHWTKQLACGPGKSDLVAIASRMCSIGPINYGKCALANWQATDPASFVLQTNKPINVYQLTISSKFVM